MDSRFHKLAPLIVLRHMPQSFHDFLICGEFTEADLSEIACYPDRLDHDNIHQSAEIHHAHSYKMEAGEDGELHWRDGDCLKTLEALAAFAVDAWREYDKLGLPLLAAITRYALSKLTHYAIDVFTYPHLHRGKPWSTIHHRFEEWAGRWLEAHREELGTFEFKPYSHVYKSVRLEAVEAWHRGAELVTRLEAGELLTDQDGLFAVRRCILGVGDLWLTLALQMGMG